MKYKLVALDLDGTLLNDKSTVSEFTKKTIKKLNDSGIHIVIATGRSYTSLKPRISELGLIHPIICYNGAMIRNGENDEVIMSSSVPDDVARALIDISRRESIHFHGFINGDFHYEKVSESAKKYQDLSGLTGVISNFDDYEKLSFTKCMFIGANDKLLTIEKEIRHLYDKKSYIAFSKPSFLEIMNFNASKAKALSRLAANYGIKRDEIIAFGDGLNDLDMLEFAGKGIVMKNGYESLKSIFENTDYTNDEDGVAKYIEKLLNE